MKDLCKFIFVIISISYCLYQILENTFLMGINDNLEINKTNDEFQKRRKKNIPARGFNKPAISLTHKT